MSPIIPFKITKVLLFIISFIVFESCMSKNNISIHNGKESIIFTSEKASYNWNFNRKYEDTLYENKRIVFKKSELLSIQGLGDSVLACQNYKNGEIHFLSLDNFSNLGSFNKKADSLREIISLDYTGNAFNLYNFTTRSLYQYNKSLDWNNDFVLKRVIKIPNGDAVYRASFLNDDCAVWANPEDKNGDLSFLLKSLDTADTVKNREYRLSNLLRLTNKDNKLGLSYDGQFISSNSSSFLVYMCSFTGYFIVFDKKSCSLKFDKRTIDETPAPITKYVQLTKNTKQLVIEPNIMFFPSASLYKNKLYILNFISTDHSGAIDIYDLDKNGEYVSSIYITDLVNNTRPKSISVVNNYLFVLYENQTIIRYAIKKS